MDFKRSSEIDYIKPNLDIFLGEYNTLLASILVENENNLAYIASPVINRMEALTHFYEKIEKYIQLKDMLRNDANLGLIIEKEDELIYNSLRNKFKSRVKKADNEKLSITIKDVLKNFNILRFCVRLVIVFFGTVRLVLVARKAMIKKKEYGSIIRTYFDFRCKTADGKLREEYFGPFTVDLAKKEKLLVVYKLLHVKDLQTFLKLQREQTDFDSCLLEYFLTPGTLIKALFHFSCSKIRLKKQYFYRNRDITPLLQQAIDGEFYSLQGINVFMEFEIAKALLNLKAKRLYLPYENQAWEKVYPLVKYQTDNKDTKIIGFQHTGLSYKLVIYFPTEIEKVLHLFPDKILTVGKVFQRLLKEKAYYPCEIVEGAALRHSKFVKDGRFDIKMPHKELKKRIVYAFSYDLNKYKNILKVLTNVFKNSGIMVYLKMHPDYDENAVLRSLKIELPQNMLLAQKTAWDMVYDSVDCVVYDDNSIGIEGMIKGLKTFMLDIAEPIYDCGRMFYFTEWETTINLMGLEKLRDEISTGKFSTWFDIDKVKEYIYSYYNAYSKEKYFNSYL